MKPFQGLSFMLVRKINSTNNTCSFYSNVKRDMQQTKQMFKLKYKEQLKMFILKY